MSEVSNKRFVHFDGTKEEFISSEHPITYSDSIVFINGSGNDSSNCIYTHGEIYADNERINKLDSSLTIGLYKSGVKSAVLYMTGSDKNVASGHGSVAVGTGVVSNGSRSFAQGCKTSAGSDASVKQPVNVTDYGFSAFAEGQGSAAKGNTSHAEGLATLASGHFSHSEGFQTVASGIASHAEGALYENTQTASKGQASHAEGAGTTSLADGAHSEGVLTTSGRESDTKAIVDASTLGITGTNEELVLKLRGYGAHAEGMSTKALGTGSHAEGSTTQALSNSSHAEGDTTVAFGEASHAEGYKTQANGNQSHAEGHNTQANGNSSHAEGISTQALGTGSHAQGKGTISNGKYSFAGGENTYTEGNKSFVFGHGNIITTKGDYSDYENISSDDYYSNGLCSMAVGQGNYVIGNSAAAIGWKNVAEGKYSMAVGNHTISYNNYQFACGTWNQNDGYDSSVLFCVGGGKQSAKYNVLTATENDVYIDGYHNIDRFLGSEESKINNSSTSTVIHGHTTITLGMHADSTINRSTLKIKSNNLNALKLLTIYLPFNTYIKDYKDHDLYCPQLRWFGGSNYKYLRQIMAKNKTGQNVYLPEKTIGVLKLDCVIVKNDIYLDEYSIIETPDSPLAIADNYVIINATTVYEIDSDDIISLYTAINISHKYDYPSDYKIGSMYIKKNGKYEEILTDYWNRRLDMIDGCMDYITFTESVKDSTIYFDTSGTNKLITSDNIFKHTITGEIHPLVVSDVIIEISWSETSNGNIRFRRDDTTTFDTFTNYVYPVNRGVYDGTYGICIYADGYNEGEEVPICYFNLLDYNETIVCVLINTDKVQKPLSGLHAGCTSYCVKSDGTLCKPYINLTFDNYVYE